MGRLQPGPGLIARGMTRTCIGMDEPDAVARGVATPDAWAGLMARAQAGDKHAYRTLLLGVTPLVRAIAARALRERVEVEDAVQNVLLSLHRVRDTYDPARPFRPWLIGIARHRLLDRLRARGRRAVLEVAWEPAHETFAVDQANIEERAWDGTALRAAMASLPAAQRQAIEMTKLRELSVREAAAASGMTEGALKVAVHRGLRRLRASLGKAEV